MGKWISYILLRLGGWKYVGKVPTDKKFLVISVPHTSMWDFVWGKLAFASVNTKPVIFIKKEAFKFPVGILLKWLGAKPVNRGRGAVGLVDQIIHHYQQNDEFMVCITPEGTREKVNKWKKGFYFISQKAGIPLYLGIIDYSNKTLTMGERFILTGDMDKDMDVIRAYYTQHNPRPKHPEKFNTKIA